MKYMFFLVTLILSLNLHAENQQTPVNKKITQVHSYVNGATFNYAPADDSYGCSGKDASKAVHISWQDNENFKAMYSLALAAFASGKTVGFGVNGCITGYGGEIPKVYRVDVVD